MATIRALIVGVSDYTQTQYDNLPFCINDISAVSKAFIAGLNLDTSNIFTCGEAGTVYRKELASECAKLLTVSSCDDTVLFYFSGHGAVSQTGHQFELSDTHVKTQEIIKFLESIPAKNKVIFLDCCMAGDFTVDKTAIFDLSDTVNEFAGKGYAVIASSSARQYSFGHPEKPLSLFTSFLCEALTCTLLIREGKKSLNDIHKLLFLYLEVWNKNNSAIIQHPVFRANMGGTIYFYIQTYTPYKVKHFHEETTEYIIYSVEPSHHSMAKRFNVQVILKQPFSFWEISNLNHEIVEKIKYADIYHNEISQKRWRGKAACLIFCYFGLDENDMINTNYICCTTWADDTQNKNWWYRINKNTEVINNIHFYYRPYYQSLKVFIGERTATKDELVADCKTTISRMVTLAEQIIAVYNEFTNRTKSESELTDYISVLIPEISCLYRLMGNLAAPTKELKDWSDSCLGLAGTIHDFTLLYNSKVFKKRTPENRKACMGLSIKQYFEDLEELKKLEATIQ